MRFQGRKGAVARAVDGVDLAVREGEVLALVGESGCGKTTLARTIMGLERPAAGEVWFRGEPLRYDARSLKAYRRGVQMVFQDPTGALNPRQTIYEAVAEGLRIHGLSDGEEAAVADALSISGLRPPERFFPLYPYEVSGGQRQRVVIAGAMALDPWLIVADEPVSSLDASVRGEILALMLELVREKGVTILVVTHDLGLAWNIADRVAVMYLGRIVELGHDRGDDVDPATSVHAGAALGRARSTSRWSSRSSRARRRTRAASRRVAASTRAARSSSPARPSGSASSSAAAARISRSMPVPGDDAHLAACHAVAAGQQRGCRPCG